MRLGSERVTASGWARVGEAEEAAMDVSAEVIIQKPRVITIDANFEDVACICCQLSPQ